jgi:uncharacterized protein YciI
MKPKNPEKLFLCLLKTKPVKGPEDMLKAIREKHARYMGDLWQKGIFWAGGPTADGSIAIEIYSVDTVEEAQKAQRNAPLYVNGFLYEDKYFEWHPKHWPPPG